MPMHPQVHLKAGAQEADVDEEMVPILRLLWEAGVRTTMSCQERGDTNAPPEAKPPHIAAWFERRRGCSWISFDPNAAGRFYDLIVDGDPSDEIYERMTGFLSEHAWEKDVWMAPNGPGHRYAPGAIGFTFPSFDRAEIVACLERAAAKRAGSSVDLVGTEV